MQKNWYIIYTKPNAEKKVASALTRKKIEIFFPLNSITQHRKAKLQKVPLFKSYLFARLSETEKAFVLSLNNVINFVYWKQQPIAVEENDIVMIKEFVFNYNDIVVQKIDVSTNNFSKVLDGFQRSFSGNVLTIKNTVTKINLPMIGFSMTAKVDQENSLYPEIASTEKYLSLQ
jgi:transcription antitermination factor NusG